MPGTTQIEYAQQGKSNNFIQAQHEGRLTVGEAAKLLSKKFGKKILARELEPLATEFHHAGRFGRRQAKRVFFLSQEEVARITEDDIAKTSIPLWGWVLGFRADYGGYHGRKRYVPIIQEVGQFPADKVHRLGDKFHPLADDEIEWAKLAIGKSLPPYCSDWREAK
jgi:hypothetical protein